MELATNGTRKYLHYPVCCTAPTVKTNSERQTTANGGKLIIPKGKKAKKKAGPAARHSGRETDTLEPLPPRRGPPHAETCLVAES